MSYIQSIDHAILLFIQNVVHCDALDFLMPIITLFGDYGIFWILLSLVLLSIKKYRRIGLTLLLSLCFSFLLCNLTLKPLVMRPRPFDLYPSDFVPLIPAPHDYSFPSGHSSASFAAAGALLYHNKRFGFFAVLLASMIALSRIYLCVHYPSDVIGGICLGLLCSFLAQKIMEKIPSNSFFV